jgi:serine beta-lactamase-like protein LACTB
MRRQLRWILAIGGFLGVHSCGSQSVKTGSSGTSPLSVAQFGTAIAEARAYAGRLYDSLALPGLAIAVAVHDEILLTAEFGYSDVAARQPIVPTSQFRIGSVSKVVTTAALARLVQQGKVDLDAGIGRYLPTLPPDKLGITSRQLAGHQGGIRHYGQGEFSSTRAYPNVAASFGSFIRDTLLSPPGTRQSYSSYGYNLLAAVMEAATGQEYRQLIRDEVTRPLGLHRTMVEASLENGDKPVSYYVKNQGMLEAAPMVDLSDRWPSGGFLSTASDLARLGSGILRSSYLNEATRVLLFTPQKLANGTDTNVALGWRVATDSAGRRFVHHGGEAMGGRAFLLVYPEQRVVVAMLANQSFAPFREKEAGNIARMFIR